MQRLPAPEGFAHEVLTSAFDKAMSHESAKKGEQDLEVENSKIGESQITRSDLEEQEVDEVMDGQITDVGVEVDPKDKEEPTVRGETEAASLSLHELGWAPTN